MLIAITGAQGTGKTTLLNALKESSLLKNYKFIDEITRDVKREGHPINENGNDETQFAIMNKHIENSRLENAIMDRCALDCFVYTSYLLQHNKISYETYSLIEFGFRHLMEKYDLIFYIKPEFELVDDGVRSADKGFRDEVYDIFENIIAYYDLPVIEVTGSVEERVKRVEKIIKEKEKRC